MKKKKKDLKIDSFKETCMRWKAVFVHYKYLYEISSEYAMHTLSKKLKNRYYGYFLPKEFTESLKPFDFGQGLLPVICSLVPHFGKNLCGRFLLKLV